MNSNTYEYKGIYYQANDVNERVYSYRFDVYDPQDNLFCTSGDLLHNHSNDTELNTSYDVYILPQELPIGDIYKIQYTVTTNNLLTISSPKYRIMQKPSIDPEIKATLNATLNYDNGYITIDLVGATTDGVEEPITGAFLLTRAAEATNYMVWDEILRFKLEGEVPSRQLLRDFTIEQGQNYKYALQQYNYKGLYSNRILSNTIYADFEDAFLYDGKQQLKIKYNPKMSSFKKDLLETKTDTIGGTHPFIFRNGRVYYSEFPISGLISYQMDEENLFLPEADYILNEKTTNLVSDNIASERIFKMKVLEWLTNGETKLFRSPTEGNYIVRLMNTSLTPNDTLGRMLHTFSSTAYEIADYNYQNLSAMKFITLNDPEVETLRWETAMFYDTDANGKKVLRTPVNHHEAITAQFNDFLPGEKIKLTFADGSNETIQIGATGSYYIDEGMAIKTIELDTTENIRGSTIASVTYSYKSILQNVFDTIENIMITETTAHQFIGEHDILRNIEYVHDSNKHQWIKNPKVSIVNIYDFTLQKRDCEKLVIKDNKYYLDAQCTISFDPASADPFTIYACGTWGGANYRPGYTNVEFTTEYYYDFYNEKRYEAAEYAVSAQLDKEIISVKETGQYSIKNPDLFTTLKTHNGVVATISYQIRTVDYRVEFDEYYSALIIAKRNYEEKVKELQDYYASLDNAEIEITDEIDANIKTYIAQIKTLYTTYILELIKAQEEEKKAEGLL